MKREIVSIIVVFLFFGLAIAPSINADDNKVDDFVELDVEFCGLGKKNTVKLTQEEYQEIELIFDEVQDRLSLVDSDDEAVDIFNEAIVKLDEYDLLGVISVKQAQNLVIRGILSRNLFTKMNNLNNNLESSANYNCLIGGRVKNGMISQNFISRSIYTSTYLLGKYASDKGFEILESFASYLWTFIAIFYSFSIINWEIVGWRDLFILSFFRTFYAGHWMEMHLERFYHPADVNLTSYSSGVSKQWNGELWGNASDILLVTLIGYHYPAILGFTGIKLNTKNFGTFILGYALKVDFTDESPW